MCTTVTDVYIITSAVKAVAQAVSVLYNTVKRGCILCHYGLMLFYMDVAQD